jgi:hypothetical protein
MNSAAEQRPPTDFVEKPGLLAAAIGVSES